MLFVSRKTHTDSLFTVSLESGEQDEKGIIIVLSNFLLLNYSASWWCRLHNGFSSKNFHKCSVSAAWQQLSMVLWLRRAWCLEGLSLLICVWGVFLWIHCCMFAFCVTFLRNGDTQSDDDDHHHRRWEHSSRGVYTPDEEEKRLQSIKSSIWDEAKSSDDNQCSNTQEKKKDSWVQMNCKTHSILCVSNQKRHFAILFSKWNTDRM